MKTKQSQPTYTYIRISPSSKEKTYSPQSKKGVEIRARLGFLDESGLSDRPPVRSTWAPEGRTPVIRSAGGWSNRSAVGMIACSPTGRRPKLYLGISKTAVSEERLLRFLTDYRKHEKRKLLLVWDRLPAHRSKKMQRILEENKSWLTVEYFPSYAPELDPVEYLWSGAKQKDFANFCPDRVKQLEGRLRRSGRRIKKQ